MNKLNRLNKLYFKSNNYESPQASFLIMFDCWMFILEIYTVTSVCNRPIAADYINQPIGKFLVIIKAIFFFFFSIEWFLQAFQLWFSINSWADPSSQRSNHHPPKKPFRSAEEAAMLRLLCPVSHTQDPHFGAWLAYLTLRLRQRIKGDTVVLHCLYLLTLNVIRRRKTCEDSGPFFIFAFVQ